MHSKALLLQASVSAVMHVAAVAFVCPAYRSFCQCCIVGEDAGQLAEVAACTVTAEGLQVPDQLLGLKATQPDAFSSLHTPQAHPAQQHVRLRPEQATLWVSTSSLCFAATLPLVPLVPPSRDRDHTAADTLQHCLTGATRRTCSLSPMRVAVWLMCETRLSMSLMPSLMRSLTRSKVRTSACSSRSRQQRMAPASGTHRLSAN